jgi:uncharacterized protein (DUF924 family)
MQFLDVYQFWFEECNEQDWWKKSAEFDRTIEKRFAHFHQAAVRGELAHWRTEPIGALCEIIVLDQFSRNIYRDTAESFASDPLALCLAQHAIEKGFDQQLAIKEVSFLYMPFMHSESAIIHEQALILFKKPRIQVRSAPLAKLGCFA